MDGILGVRFCRGRGQVGVFIEVNSEVRNDEDEEEEAVHELQRSNPLHQTNSTRHERARHLSAEYYQHDVTNFNCLRFRELISLRNFLQCKYEKTKAKSKI